MTSCTHGFHGLRKWVFGGGGNCSAFHSREAILELVRLELIYSFLQLHSWEVETWSISFNRSLLCVRHP